MNQIEVKENIDWSNVIAMAKSHVDRALNKKGGVKNAD
jgi:hypothetical protein